MPEEWWKDTTADLFTPWEQHDWENTYANDYTLGKARERSLCYPLAAEGTMRYMESSPFGGVMICRVEDGRLYVKHSGGRDRRLTNEESYVLTADELDSVSNAVADFHRTGRPNDESGLYVIDGSTFVLEYIFDGRYYRYTTSSGAVPPQLEAIWELLRSVLKRK